MSDENKELNEQHRTEILKALYKISDERFLRRLWISVRDYVIEKGGADNE